MFGPKAHVQFFVHYVTKKCKLIIRRLDRVLKRCYTRIFNVCFRAGSAVGELYLDDGESVNLRNVHTKLSYQLAPGILTRNKIIKSDSVTRYYTYRLSPHSNIKNNADKIFSKFDDSAQSKTALNHCDNAGSQHLRLFYKWYIRRI